MQESTATTRLLDRLFRREDIGPAGAVLLQRWVVVKNRRSRRGLYVHRFIRSEPREPHDHPKAFTTVGLWGGYLEEVFEASETHRPPVTRRWRAPWIRRFPPDHVHRVHLVDGRPCWTLVLTGARTRDWGFYVRRRAGDGLEAAPNPAPGIAWIDEAEFHAREAEERR